jgi:hypothetical protein
LLLVGTRVTGSEPHVGTLYGWVAPLVEASRRLTVHVLIADLQSLGVQLAGPRGEAARALERSLRGLAPSHLPVLLESLVPSLPALALLCAPLFSGQVLSRVAPLRKAAREGRGVTLNTALYPAMMLADVLAFGATHVFDKPEGRFDHRDVLNDALRRGTASYGWPALHLRHYPKPRVHVPSLDGTGPMKRERAAAGYVGVEDLAGSGVGDKLRRVPAPGFVQPGEQRPAGCSVIRPLWDAVGGPRSQAAAARCRANAIACQDCATALASELQRDYQEMCAAARAGGQGDGGVAAVLARAEERARWFIDAALRPGRATDAPPEPIHGALPAAEDADADPVPPITST